jgi:hypothetical protein
VSWRHIHRGGAEGEGSNELDNLIKSKKNRIDVFFYEWKDNETVSLFLSFFFFYGATTFSIMT